MYNLGPQTVSEPHLDSTNLLFGLCTITLAALGNYDPKKGSRFVMWDCKLVIQFPPGTIVTHSNIPITSHKKQYSFTQYTAGALFQWVDNRFKMNENLYKRMTQDQMEQAQFANQQQWKFGLGDKSHPLGGQVLDIYVLDSSWPFCSNSFCRHFVYCILNSTHATPPPFKLTIPPTTCTNLKNSIMQTHFYIAAVTTSLLYLPLLVDYYNHYDTFLIFSKSGC